MPQRRRPRRAAAAVAIGTDGEYFQALKELEVLQKAPLGTDQTEGLQDLIEAILEYEGRRGDMDEDGSVG
jgi:hypothetical protein